MKTFLVVCTLPEGDKRLKRIAKVLARCKREVHEVGRGVWFVSGKGVRAASLAYMVTALLDPTGELDEYGYELTKPDERVVVTSLLVDTDHFCAFMDTESYQVIGHAGRLAGVSGIRKSESGLSDILAK